MVLRSLAGMVLLLAAAPLCAQGGPPMQNDDPSTVPDGHFEINLSVNGSSSGVAREIEWLRVDANYGVGERTQLKVETPVTRHDENGELHTGLGSTTLGVRYRFLDQDQTGIDLSTYPQVSFDLLPASEKHRVTSGDREFFLPVQVQHDFGSFKLGAEAGHTFIEHVADEFVWGVIAGTDCWNEIECMIETRTHRVSGANTSIVNAGTRAPLVKDKLNLLASAGRGIGPDSPDRPDWVFYVALQVLR